VPEEGAVVEKPDGGLSPEMAALWDNRARPRRGPKPAMSVEAIVAAAMTVADAEGLEAISMQRVAKELGYTTMSLYRYVSSKGVLLTLMLDAAIGGPPEVVAGEDWRAALQRWAWAMLERLRKHPWSLQIPISGLQISPYRLAWLDCGLQMLAGTMLAEHDKAETLLLLSSYVMSEARLARDLQQEAASSAALGEAPQTFGQTLAPLIDPARYPALAKAIAAGVLDDPVQYDDAISEFGLQRILDGIEVLMARGR
jgi:AcrR family transcriptional regulator